MLGQLTCLAWSAIPIGGEHNEYVGPRRCARISNKQQCLAARLGRAGIGLRVSTINCLEVREHGGRTVGIMRLLVGHRRLGPAGHLQLRSGLEDVF
jgi:hypothetical protein